MSPVILVKLKTPAPNRAILKLYDRRFGSSLRRSKQGNHLPCRVQDEAAFRSFVDRGDMGPFIDETEVEAYNCLKDLQGVFIPHFIPGWSLYDLPESPSSPTYQQEWTSIVQRVVQAAHEINRRDILLNDSSPRNVVVDAHSHQPFIIDLAQRYFKDQLCREWEYFGLGDGQEDWTPEAE
ncbi:serine threonine kinase fnkB [Fusarium mundagurra]|uniref:Serine threonine kinase fnkB n=1 Tax=Fusarium mundagurra TaxID=1567541 RepID=A0A8H6DF00_9HYPO|nr:serine threonine kinase fnkB [Fusarium mundagurra]